MKLLLSLATALSLASFSNSLAWVVVHERPKSEGGGWVDKDGKPFQGTVRVNALAAPGNRTGLGDPDKKPASKKDKDDDDDKNKKKSSQKKKKK